MLHFVAFSVAVLSGHFLGKLNQWSAKRSRKMDQPKGFLIHMTICVPMSLVLFHSVRHIAIFLIGGGGEWEWNISMIAYVLTLIHDCFGDDMKSKFEGGMNKFKALVQEWTERTRIVLPEQRMPLPA